ncbi:hypothetical protein EVAR_53201_1 [Eumeta japonica]|uniref:Endonuclease/exonuclease/phosphatase domain-containing protein n=1 Tax=Eumeta variegata TaxID=151549 RepID=A0A4C1YU80_EUMVA|nr:hypothetical protein EVAR_53201_1 [Eumeta japonica]
MKGNGLHKDADIIENVLAQNKHLVKDINLKEVTIRLLRGQTHEWENARVENKTRNRNARTAGRTGSKLRPTTRPLATNASALSAAKVKAAIIVFGDKVEVLHDPQLVTETESAVPLKIGRMKLGIISIYFEGDEDIEPYIIRTKKACNLGTENLIIAGDINAGATGEAREKTGGPSLQRFLDEMGFHILNTGSTPTFETYRR